MFAVFGGGAEKTFRVVQCASDCVLCKHFIVLVKSSSLPCERCEGSRALLERNFKFVINFTAVSSATSFLCGPMTMAEEKSPKAPFSVELSGKLKGKSNICIN